MSRAGTIRPALAFGAALLLAACAGEPAATDAPAPQAAATAAPAPAAAAPPAPTTAAADPRWQLSYAIGYNVGNNLIQARNYVDLDAFSQGLDDLWQHRAPRLDANQMQQALDKVMRHLANPALAPSPDSAGLPADFSYALGASIADSLEVAQDHIDPAVLKQAAAEAYDGKAAQVETGKRAELTNELRVYIAQQRQRLAGADQQRAEAFLAGNARRDGVKVTASGLQYEVLREGQGPHATRSSRVTVNYTGQLIGGEVFDDDHQPGRAPVSFPLGNVISGWIEGIQLMPAGSRYRFWIPPQLAYGERGAPPKIGPNQVLVFDVELVAVQ